MWQEVSVTVTQERADSVEMLMLEAGAQAVTLIPADQVDPVLEPAPDATPLWDTLIARGLFDAELSAQVINAALSSNLNAIETKSLSIADLADQPWERTWLDHFEPARFGSNVDPDRGLWICPWHHQPAPKGDVVFMDPGLAFGTGSHATTGLCLDYLADAQLEGQRVLDLGCGSGILALAAALRGATEVVAVDNDPQACIATRENAERNGLSVAVSQSLDGINGPFEVIAANILSGTLIEFSSRLIALSGPGTQLILSGVLEHQAHSVSQAYAEVFGDLEIRQKDGWVSLSGIARK